MENVLEGLWEGFGALMFCMALALMLRSFAYMEAQDQYVKACVYEQPELYGANID